VLSFLGLVHRNLGNLQAALDYVTRSAFLAPSSAGIALNLGAVYSDLGRHEESLDCCKRALSLDPAIPNGHFSLATALCALKRFEEARGPALVAIAESPLDFKPALVLAAVHHASGDIEAAIEMTRTALRINPISGSARNLLNALLMESAYVLRAPGPNG